MHAISELQKLVNGRYVCLPEIEATAFGYPSCVRIRADVFSGNGCPVGSQPVT